MERVEYNSLLKKRLEAAAARDGAAASSAAPWPRGRSGSGRTRPARRALRALHDALGEPAHGVQPGRAEVHRAVAASFSRSGKNPG